MSWAENGQVDFVTLDGQTRGSEDYLISTWRQSIYMEWAAAQVEHLGDTEFNLSLGETDDGFLEGAEVQSAAVSDMGTWSWYAQAPDLDSGAVFAMFLYRADHNNDPWLEFDFEFIQGDTTSVQLAVHMEDENGTTYTVKEIIELDFDASAGAHLYELDVTETETNFLIDNQIVWTANADIMPNNLWVSGDMKAFSSLWAAVTRPEWAGAWEYGGTPMIAEFEGVGTPEYSLFANTYEASYQSGREYINGLSPHELLGSDYNDKIIGDKRSDELHGGAGDDFIAGAAGRDFLHGGAGDDFLAGGDSHDILSGDDGDDLLYGGAHFDTLTGGSGADTFVFAYLGYSRDIVTDFSLADGDVLDMTGLDLSSISDLTMSMIGDGIYQITTTSGDLIVELHSDRNAELSLASLLDQDALFY